MFLSILSWIVFGFVVGLVARALFPGTQALGFVGTTLLGILGAFVGGFIASLIGGYPVFSLRTSGLFGSILGALIALGLSAMSSRGRHSAT